MNQTSLEMLSLVIVKVKAKNLLKFMILQKD